MMFYKTFKTCPDGQIAGAYGHGCYDLTHLPQTLPALDGEPIICQWGYHFCGRDTLVGHISEIICEVRPLGDVVEGVDKCATTAPLEIVRRLDRWTPQVQRLFAADCAERTLHLAHDARCDDVVRIARLHALGRATDEELDTAWDAARDAARAAERQWQTERLFDWLEGRRTADDVIREMGL